MNEYRPSPRTISASEYAGRMRMIIFVEDFGATGVVRNAIAIATRLSTAGHEVVLLALKPTGILRSIVPPEVTTAALNASGGGRTRRSLMRHSLGRFRKFVREYRPDLVFSAGNHGHLLVLAGTRFSSARVVVRISNDIDHRTPGRASSLWSRWVRRLKFGMIAALADRVVLVSDRLSDQIGKLDPALARKSIVIPNGVDVAGVRGQSLKDLPVIHAFDGSAPVALAMGRLVPQKNFGTLLEAIAIARKSADVRLLLIGTGPRRAELTEAAQSLGIADALQIVDPIPNPFPVMKRASVLVLPSWWEGSSNVMLEALTCGTPVVASRTAGNAEEILGEDRYGLLVDPANAEEMAAAILRQIGPQPVLPKDRAKGYDRDAALCAYEELIAGIAPK